MRGIFHPLFLATTVVVTALDLGSKAWAWRFVGDHGDGVVHKVYTVAEPWFRLVRAENTGTIWGLFQGLTAVLIGVRCAMIVALLVVAFRTPARDRLKLLGFGLVLGGALGNLYDNLFRASGAVRDFLDFWIPLPWQDDLWHYPTFNVADSSILCGAVLLFFAFSREREVSAETDAKPIEGS